ncbi:MAG: CAP domain-containing protein [Chloroflexi bacterium]|nr:CAP domain-containing protein [Chloroflexota bacterium]
MTRSRPFAAVSRLVVAAMLAATFVTAVGPIANPAPVAASTSDTMESMVVSLVNAERTKLGLVPLRLHSGLISLAGDRAAYMASIGAMQHISCLSCTLNARGIQWYSAGEVIASNNYPWGSQAAQQIFNGWMSSSTHRAILMSSTYNYIGVGVAYRSANGWTYASSVLTESRDRTRPWARMSTAWHSGTTVYWSWTGADTRLQTHTAGLKNFDVQYRVGTGTWVTIRSGTTARSLYLYGRAHGRWYGLRVRARDNLGYVSSYSAELRVWVP